MESSSEKETDGTAGAAAAAAGEAREGAAAAGEAREGAAAADTRFFAGGGSHLPCTHVCREFKSLAQRLNA